MQTQTCHPGGGGRGAHLEGFTIVARASLSNDSQGESEPTTIAGHVMSGITQ